jgi:thiamine biosynthesis protein ThiC
MIEGPGHVPFDQIEYNMKLQRRSATARRSTCSARS